MDGRGSKRERSEGDRSYGARSHNTQPNATRGNLVALLESMRGEIEALRELLEITRNLTSILEPDELLAAILDAAIRLSRAERGFLLTGDTDAPRAILGRGGARTTLDPATDRFSVTLARRCRRENRVLSHEDLANIPALAAVRSIRALSLHGALCLPLRERGEARGVLYLDSTSPGLRTAPREIALLEAFAAQASIALWNARRLQLSEESRVRLARENEGLRSDARPGGGIGSILGRSAAMQSVFDRVRLLREAEIPVLLLGESGTGKELVARALHDGGVTRDGPFVPVNCAGLPSDLLDSMMFGHRRGSFTGAIADMPGFVERADGGTLFLDEIGDMPPALQVKCLRFLESGDFRRVGEVEERHARVRVISATHQNLFAMIRRHRFREDLYFRVAGVCLEIPPLRERREDIPILVEYFLGRSPRRHGDIPALTDAAAAYLLGHDWPGNVRQLRQVIEGACALAPPGEPIDEGHIRMVFPQAILGGRGRENDRFPEGGTRSRRPSGRKRALLESVLERNDWNVAGAARQLGVSRQHLHRRIRQFGLQRPVAQDIDPELRD